MKPDGYVMVTIEGKRMQAHRYAYNDAYGDLTDDGVILHTCDNPSCINPKHLVQGTHQDNVRDRVEKDRSAKGTRNGRSKLTEEQVREIKRDKASTNKQLGQQYGIDPANISKIRTGKVWGHVKP
jgi:hypothetical protein